MKKIIKESDKKRGIIQVTVADERWYVKSTTNKKTKNPETVFVPSVTWIGSFYPKGIGFMKWLASKGWDEAEAIKISAGERGTMVHYACEDLAKGNEVTMETKYVNPETEQEQELSLEEYSAAMSFADWCKKVEPDFVSNEIVSFSEKYGYAGTIDIITRIDNELWIIDIKTSSNIWPSHKLQISAYKHSLLEELLKDEPRRKALGISLKELKNIKLGILQLGYKRNRNGYKFTEIEDKFDLFLAAKEIWEEEAGKEKPSVKDYPVSLKLEYLKNKKVEKNNKNNKK